MTTDIRINERCFTCANKHRCPVKFGCNALDIELRKTRILAFDCYVHNENTFVEIDADILNNEQPAIETEEKSPCAICRKKQTCPLVQMSPIMKRMFFSDDHDYECFEQPTGLHVDRKLLPKHHDLN